MKSSSAVYGTNSIYVFKHIFKIIGPFVTEFNNRSLKSEIFPNSLKVAKIKCFYKKGGRCDVNNYRHISILPTYGKILEKKTVFDQIYHHFTLNNLFTAR